MEADRPKRIIVNPETKSRVTVTKVTKVPDDDNNKVTLVTKVTLPENIFPDFKDDPEEREAIQFAEQRTKVV